MIYSVFVIMPFEEDFDAVYHKFIKPEFEGIQIEDVRFQVSRADDIANLRSILNDIVIQIARSDLVVADLTGSNPNVFYELGLAHALRRSVILLTQNIDDVPFDLRPYRTLEYSTHFAKIDDAKAALRAYAQKFAEGEVRFGNPVMDYLHVDRDVESMQEGGEANSYKDDRGFFDHIMAIVQGYSKLGAISDNIAESIEQDVSEPMVTANLAFERLSSRGSAVDPSAAQTIARRLAMHISKFNDKLSEANMELSEITDTTGYSLEIIASFVVEQYESDDKSLGEQFDQLRILKNSIKGARDSCNILIEVTESLPRMERRLNLALDKLTKELRIYGNILDMTIASITRALNIWASRRA